MSGYGCDAVVFLVFNEFAKDCKTAVYGHKYGGASQVIFTTKFLIIKIFPFSCRTEKKTPYFCSYSLNMIDNVIKLNSLKVLVEERSPPLILCWYRRGVGPLYFAGYSLLVQERSPPFIFVDTGELRMIRQPRDLQLFRF